jgi:hypothetical protein
MPVLSPVYSYKNVTKQKGGDEFIPPLFFSPRQELLFRCNTFLNRFHHTIAACLADGN